MRSSRWTILKALVRLRIAESFSGFGRRRKLGQRSGSGSGSSGGAGRIVLYIGLAVIIMLSLGVTFFGISISLSEFNMMELYFPIIFILAFLLCFVGSVFLAQHQIFEAKDNDQMFSMPVPPRLLLISRILSLIVVNYYYESMIVIPGAVVYGRTFGFSVLGIVNLIICALFTPLLVVTISMIFGYLIALVSSRLRNSRIVGLVLSVAALGAYMFFISTWQQKLEQMAMNGVEAAAKIRRFIAPAWHFGNAAHTGSASSLLIFLLICIVPFVIACLIVGHNFIRIATTQRGMKKLQYKGGAMKTGSSFSALVRMEFGRLAGSNVYMLNSAFGLLIIVLLAVLAIFKRNDLMEVLTEIGGAGFGSAVGPLITIAIIFMTAMIFISSATISLDGYTMWMPKSLPVRGFDVLLAKTVPHILVSLPAFLIAAAAIQFAVPMESLWRVGVILLPLIATVHNALLGVVMNLRFPKFDWLTEAYAVKQGLAPMLTMLVSFIPAMILMASFGFFIVSLGLPSWMLFVEALVLYGVLSAVLYIILKKWGTARFAKLQS